MTTALDIAWGYKEVHITRVAEVGRGRVARAQEIFVAAGADIFFHTVDAVIRIAEAAVVDQERRGVL